MIIWPEYISLKDWAADVVASYPNDPLPLLDNEDDWQEWAAIVAGTGFFSRAGIPSPFSLVQGRKKPDFETWEEWAKVVYLKINYQVQPQVNVIV